MVLTILIKTLSIVDNLTGAISSITGGFEQFGTAAKWRAVSSTLKSMAIALGVFAACMLIISNIPAEDAVRSAHILVGFLVVMGIIVGTLMALSTKINGTINVAAVALSLLGMVGALFLLVLLVEKIDSITLKHPLRSILIVLGILLVLAVSIRIVGAAAGGGTIKSVAAIVTMLTACKMVLSLLEDYANYPWNDVKSAIPKLAGVLLSLAIVIRIMTGGIKAGANTSGMALLMLSLMASLWIILKMVQKFAAMDPDEMEQGIKAITRILWNITAMLAVFSLVNRGNVLDKGQKSANTFKGFAIALLAVAAAIYILGKMDRGTLTQGGVAIVVIMGMMSLLASQMGKLKDFNTAKLLAILAGFAIVIVGLGHVVKSLSEVGWKDALGSAGALSLLLLAMVRVLKVCSKFEKFGKAAWSAIGGLAVITLVVAGLARILYQMKSVDGVNAIAQAGALAILLGVMAGVLWVCSTFGAFANAAWSAIGAMGALSIVVGTLAHILDAIKDVDGVNAIPQVIAISILLAAMAGVLFVCSTFGAFANAAWSAIGAMAVLGIVVGMLAHILDAIKEVDGTNAIKQVVAISILLAVMTGVMYACSLIGPAATAALPALGVLALAIVALGAIVWSLGALANKFESFGPAIEKGAEIMGFLGEAIGSFVGKLIGSFAEGITSTLPQLGQNLSDFWTNIQPFIDGISGIDAGIVSNVGTLASAISELGKEGFSNAIRNFFSGGTSLSDLGTNLSDFWDNASDFFDGVSGIKEDSVTGVKTLADTVSMLTDASFTDGLTAFGNNSGLTRFGERLLPFGESLVDFSNEVANVNTEAIVASSAAAQGLADLLASMPDDGLLDKLKGKKDFSTLTDNLSSLGTALKDYAGKVTGLDVDSIASSVTAAQGLNDLLKALPGDDGLWQKIAGRKDFGTLSSNLVGLGKALKGYASEVEGLDGDSIASSVTAAQGLNDLLTALPGDDGLWQKIAGSKDFNTLSTNLVDFGKALKGYASEVDGLDADSIASSATAAQGLTDILNALPSDDGIWQKIIGRKDLGDFATNLDTFGKALKSYSGNVAGIEVSSIDNSVKGAMKLTELINAIPSEKIFDGKMNLNTFSSKMQKLGTALATFKDIDPSGAENAVTAANKLKTLINAIPSEGVLDGKMDLNTFSSKMKKLSSSLASFSGFDPSSAENAVTAVNKLKTLINTIPSEGAFDGKMDLNVFSSKMKTLSASLTSFSGFDLSAVTNAVTGVNQLKTLINTIPSEDALAGKINLSVFGATLVNLGNNLATFGASASSAGDILGVVANLRSLSSFLSSLGSADFSGVGTFKAALNELGTISVSEIVAGISSGAAQVSTAVSGLMSSISTGIASASGTITTSIGMIMTNIVVAVNARKQMFYAAGATLGQRLAAGLQSQSASVSGAGRQLGEDGASTLNDYYSDFYDAGGYLVEGFAAGITDNTFQAEAAAAAMAEKAYEAAKTKLKVNSPSKLFRRLAYSVPEGFAQGIERKTWMSDAASTDMAQSAIDSAATVLSGLDDAMSSDASIQPTIRPVVDMSAATVSSLDLGSNIDVSLNGHIDSLSQLITGAQMDIRNSNLEVINAINGLRDDLSVIGVSLEDRETALYIDSKKLASSIAKPMNRQLNILSQRGAYA